MYSYNYKFAAVKKLYLYLSALKADRFSYSQPRTVIVSTGGGKALFHTVCSNTRLHSKPHAHFTTLCHNNVSLSPQHAVSNLTWTRILICDGSKSEEMWEKCVTGFKEGDKTEKERERERELKAEIKIMMGSPHQYTATPLCHPWQRTGLRHPTGQHQDRHRWPGGGGSHATTEKKKPAPNTTKNMT